MVYLSKNSESTDLPSSGVVPTPSVTTTATSNFEQWLKFLFGI